MEMTKVGIIKERKNRVLEVLSRHQSPEEAISQDEMGAESFVGYSELRRTIFDLAVNDKLPIKMTGFPVKFYLDEEKA